MSKNTQAVNFKWYPRLFTDDMVRELLADRKTATRWPLRKQPAGFVQKIEEWTWGDAAGNTYRAPVCPGDIIWAREAWRPQEVSAEARYCVIKYRADRAEQKIGGDTGTLQMGKNPMHWKPSIFMPRKVARIFLRVTDVRLVRVQDISEEETRTEGVMPPPEILDEYPFWNGKYNFATLWDTLYEDRGLGWDVNPWVWAASFRRISKAEAEA